MTKVQEIILLVDDSRAVRKQIGSLLVDQGYEVILAEDGRQAMVALGQADIDLIVSDLEMPFMNGLELCQQVKGDEQLSHIYFILLTARAEIEARVEGLDIGADDYIVKSTHQQEFIARVRSGLRVRRLEKELLGSQAQLFHLEKMASVGQLAAGLAHEINNPIGFILSDLSALEKYLARLTEFMTEQQKLVTASPVANEDLQRLDSLRRRLKIDQIVDDSSELVSECRQGAERIAEVVGNLRNFMDDATYDCQMIDLNHSLGLTIDLIMQEIKNVPPPQRHFNPLPLVYGYAHQLHQAFAHVIRNAAQAVTNGGEFSVSSQVDERDILLKVIDNGSGISPQHLARIYDPFFTTREVGQGIGIGLTIAYNIIQKHGGTIAVDSKLGEGTTVTMRLPIPS